VAALYVRKGVRIIPLLDGGIQEGGRRAGTENVPGIVGMGKAAELARTNLATNAARLTALRDALLEQLPAQIKHVTITGHPARRLPGNASFCIAFIEGEAMLLFLNMQGIAVTSGSACTSRALKASHVLIAMGLSHEIAQGSILFSFGPGSVPEDVGAVMEALPPIVERLRQMSPLYAKFTKSGKAG
jgi:cysteine desulfurase